MPDARADGLFKQGRPSRARRPTAAAPLSGRCCRHPAFCQPRPRGRQGCTRERGACARTPNMPCSSRHAQPASSRRVGRRCIRAFSSRTGPPLARLEGKAISVRFSQLREHQHSLAQTGALIMRRLILKPFSHLPVQVVRTGLPAEAREELCPQRLLALVTLTRLALPSRPKELAQLHNADGTPRPRASLGPRGASRRRFPRAMGALRVFLSMPTKVHRPVPL